MDRDPRLAPLVAAIRSDPHFPAAMRASAEAIVAAYAGNRLLSRVISDRGRTVFGILAMYLHFHPDEAGAGLTPSRMAGLCAEAGVCSRGRVKALLVLLRWAGHLAPGDAGGDQRRRPLVPTARMIAAYRTRWRDQLELLAPMLPGAAETAAGLARPDVFARFAVALGGVFRRGFRVLDHCPALAPVAERDNGMLMLLRLALSGDPDDRMPPEQPVAVPVAALAGSARVSRTHALNLLREAERRGLIRREENAGAPATVTCLPPFEEAIAGFFAATYAALAAAVVRVEGPRGPPLSG